MKINLLIVEDNLTVINQWKEKLQFYAIEKNPVYIITPTFVNNSNDAEKLLENTKFDAAVIDIRLDEDGKQTDNGNKILKILSHTSLTVCAVYTGEKGTEKVEDHLKDFVKVFVKGDGDGIERMLAWLDQKTDMLSAIQTMQESFNKSMAKAFTRSIWPRWSYWLDKSVSGSTEEALTRHMATHLHASFLANDKLGAHPEEYFFIPPLQDHLNTGDIILQNDTLEVIVTPRCDMLRSKSSIPTYQLVTLLDRSSDWDNLKAKLVERKKTPNNERKINSALSEIIRFTNHNNETGGHFIQEFRTKIDGIEQSFGPFYAQFNLLRSLERNEANEKELLDARIASLANEFIPSLVERLGAYFSRIGTPDYSHPDYSHPE